MSKSVGEGQKRFTEKKMTISSGALPRLVEYSSERAAARLVRSTAITGRRLEGDAFSSCSTQGPAAGNSIYREQHHQKVAKLIREMMTETYMSQK